MPPNYCSLLFGSGRILSIFVTSAAEIFVHQAARPITALVRGAAPVPVVVIPFSSCGELSRNIAHHRWLDKDLSSKVVFCSMEWFWPSLV